VYWYAHFKLFSVLKTYDLGLVLRNLLLLFFIALFPFGSTLFSEAFTIGIIPLILYIIITFGCGFSLIILGNYVFSKPELLDEHADITVLKLEYDYTKWFTRENIKKNGLAATYRKWRDRKNVKKN